MTGKQAGSPRPNVPETEFGVTQNDTYGPLDRQELADMRACASPCLICGMLATVDPIFHERRYRHAPEIVGNLRWSTSSMMWVKK